MKIKTNKILLSTAAALTLLLAGCTDDQKAALETAMNNSDTVSNATEGNTVSSKTGNNNSNPDVSNGSGKTGAGSTNDSGTTGENTITVSGDLVSDIGNDNSGDTDTSTGDIDNGNSGDDLIPGDGNGADIPTTANKTGGWYGRTVVRATASEMVLSIPIVQQESLVN